MRLLYAIVWLAILTTVVTLLTAPRVAVERYQPDPPRTHFLSFAHGDCYRGFASKLVSDALAHGGFDQSRLLDMTYVDERFAARNRSILARPRGHGYWLWKPYSIFRYALESVRDGDVIVYVDSLYRFQAPPPARKFAGFVADALAGTVDDVFVVEFKPEPNRHKYVEREWNKADVYAILGATDESFKDTTQVWGGFFAMRKSVRSMTFLSEWLAYCQNSAAVTDDPSALGSEDPGYREHRHDQSILSLLAKKRGIPILEFPRGYMIDLRHAGEGSC